VWHCLCDPTFSRFSRTPTCDRQIDRRLWHKGDPCNMDHLRICLQIIVKFQLASANDTPSCRALIPRLELVCIVLNGTQYIGKKRD